MTTRPLLVARDEDRRRILVRQGAPNGTLATRLAITCRRVMGHPSSDTRGGALATRAVDRVARRAARGRKRSALGVVTPRHPTGVGQELGVLACVGLLSGFAWRIPGCSGDRARADVESVNRAAATNGGRKRCRRTVLRCGRRRRGVDRRWQWMLASSVGVGRRSQSVPVAREPLSRPRDWVR